jgi:prefoldin beta subunit
MNNRQQFVQQYSENDMVLKELEKLEDDANVFKLIGPVLIKQDLVEAKSNVGKRLEFISNETERLDKMVKSMEHKQEVKHKEITELQKKVQALFK